MSTGAPRIAVGSRGTATLFMARCQPALTCLMYEGAPNHPAEDRFWDLVEKYKVTILYTAPTAIRAFIKWGDQHVEKHDLSSLRLLGSVGEGINPEAWMWYHEKIGGEKLPDRRYVVANRNRRHHDEPVAGNHGIPNRAVLHATISRACPGDPGRERKTRAAQPRWHAVRRPTVARNVARHLGRRRAVRPAILVHGTRAST